jgi:hypothetical protein
MPKRILAIAFAATALALAACNGGDINDLYGTPAPTATATVASPNPSASVATVGVFVSNSPLPNQPVSLYTATSSGQIGTLISTQTTTSTGGVTFTNLTPTQTYCFYSQYTPAGAPTQTATRCTNLWGDEEIELLFNS